MEERKYIIDHRRIRHLNSDAGVRTLRNQRFTGLAYHYLREKPSSLPWAVWINGEIESFHEDYDSAMLKFVEVRRRMQQ